MKISTSTSFVVASIALSSSALALPVPHTDPIPYARSPDLAASPHAPHSARVVQDSQMLAVARSGKGRPPAIRSGSGSRRSLPRRSKSMHKRSDETDKSLSDTVNGLLGSLESALAPFGLGIVTAPKKESVGDADTTPDKPLRFARQIPQAAPQSQPPNPDRANQVANAAAEQAEGFFPYGYPGVGIPGAVQGEIPGFVPSYPAPAFPGQPPFAVPNGGQPRVPEGFSGIPSQMMGELQTGESNLPAGTVGEAAGQVPSELQNAVGNTADGLLPGLPLGNLMGGTPASSLLSGLSPQQIAGLVGLLGSSAGQATGNLIPGGFSNSLGGVTGTVGGLTSSLPLLGGLNPFGALEGGPPNGEEPAGESASSNKPQPSADESSSMASSSESDSETMSTTTLPSTSSSANASEATSSSTSSSESSMSDTTSTSSSDAEPKFAVNVAPDPAAVASSHSLPTGSHSLPVPAPVQSKASSAPTPQAPSPPIIHVQAPSPTPSGTESGTETSSSSFDDQSTSSTESTSPSSATDSSSSSASSSSSSSSSAAEPTTSSTINPAERRMLLSRITRYFRRGDPPLPKGFAAPTGPIPNDTPPLLQPTVKFPGGKVEKDQAPATDADASSSVTSSATSESQTGSSSCSEEPESMDSSDTTSSESTVSTSVVSA